MATVVAHTKIKRDFKKYIYFIKEGGVWQAPRRGSKGGKKKMIKRWGTKKDMDYSRFIYFLDKHGNVAAAARKNSRGGRKASASTGRTRRSTGRGRRHSSGAGRAC